MVLVACETEPIIFNGPYFVRFTETTLTEKESHIPIIPIEVHIAGPVPKNDITINYTISGTAREGTDYTIVGTKGKVKIKSGEYVGKIELRLINNSNDILRSQDIVITLQTVDNNTEKVYMGQGVSQIGKSFTLTIQDDCILGGDYYGLSDDKSVPVPGITITSLNCADYVLSNWDIDIFTFPSVRSLKFIDNGDNTLTIPPQEDASLPEEIATIDGSGVINPATRVITMTIRLVDYEDQPEFSFNLIPN
jgi:hypothetical protein